MHKHEDTVYGMELEGEHIVKDVCQRRVLFDDHQVYSPAEDESSTRLGLKCCMFEGLVNNALANISMLRIRRRELETQQRILNARIRSHSRVSADTGQQIQLLDAKEKLKKVEKELNRLQYMTPDVCLEQVKKTLEQADQYIRLKKISYRLDGDNIVRSKHDDKHKGKKLRFSEIIISGQQPRIVTLAKINRSDVSTEQNSTYH
jgi:hypothetical protein